MWIEIDETTIDAIRRELGTQFLTETLRGFLRVLDNVRDRPSPDPITKLMSFASDDEIEVVRRFAVKVMGEGREEHGRLCLSTEDRTPENFYREAIDERLDSEFYVLVAEMLGERS